METVLIGHILVIITFISKTEAQVSINAEHKRNKYNLKKCDVIAEDPYFSTEMVVGKPWRIYYDWQLVLHKNCVDMKFKYVTPEIVSRIYNDMTDFLEEQPMWNAATLLLKTGKASNEILLIADQGPEGRFIGVLNVARDGRHVHVRHEQPLMKFQLKLYGKGKYLLIMDCYVGAGSISVRADQPPPTREEIDQLREQYKLDTGYHVCENYNPRKPF